MLCTPINKYINYKSYNQAKCSSNINSCHTGAGSPWGGRSSCSVLRTCGFCIQMGARESEYHGGCAEFGWLIFLFADHGGRSNRLFPDFQVNLNNIVVLRQPIGTLRSSHGPAASTEKACPLTTPEPGSQVEPSLRLIWPGTKHTALSDDPHGHGTIHDVKWGFRFSFLFSPTGDSFTISRHQPCANSKIQEPLPCD